MPDEIYVRVNGQRWSGWESIDIVRSLQAVAGSFTITAATGLGLPPMLPGDAVQIQRGTRQRQDVLIDGFVDSVQGDDDSRIGLTWTIAGRDRSGDLVDASVAGDQSEFINQNLLTIAARLLEPFDLEVTVFGDIGPNFELFAIQPGEPVWSALERACRLRGMIANYDPNFDLLRLSNSSEREKAVVALEEGKNIKGATFAFDYSQLHSSYEVKGLQVSSFFSDADSVEAEVPDATIRRHRPLVILSEGIVATDAALKRAEWEKTVRLARSQSIGVTLQGWREVETDAYRGPVWREGKKVDFRYGSLSINAELVVDTVNLTASEQFGDQTTLTLAPPGAYTKMPDIETVNYEELFFRDDEE